MPQADGGHADVTSQYQQITPKMEAGRAQRQRLMDQTESIGKNGEATITLKESQNRITRNKRSLDYVLRTGLAGGLAGCAVSRRFSCCPDEI